jgi:hypothetical protein
VVYRGCVSYKMIKVDSQTHSRLAKLAEEQGVTIGGLVGELAASRPTRADSDAFLAAVEARFGRPDAEALDRVNELLDQNTMRSGKKPAA